MLFRSARFDTARADPVVQALLAAFPGAELTGVDPIAERIANAQSR